MCLADGGANRICADRADSVCCEETWHNYPDCQLAVTGLSFGDENKCCEKPYSIVRVVYLLRPSLTTGVRK